MKKLYFLFFLTIGFLANSQIINFPDADFKYRLLSASSSNTIAKNLSGAYFKIDSNNDGEIQILEAQQVKYLKVANYNLTSLIGIEYFTNIQTLYCYNNNLINLDVSNLVDLDILHCYNNQLTLLNLSNLVNLRVLYCYQNQLSSLDTSDLNFLDDLQCYQNRLVNLDMTSSVNLYSLDCSLNQIVNLNVSGLSYLANLNCGNNQLVNIDISDLSNLRTFYCGNNQITNIIMSNHLNLIDLSCGNNQLTNIDFSNIPNLTSLECSSNLFVNLDLSDLHDLSILNCNNNTQLNYLNIKNSNPEWFSINFPNNFNLNYICSNVEYFDFIEAKIIEYGYSNCHVNEYCSFTPGGIFYSVIGNIKLDNNINGCDISDINYSNLKFNITNGSNSGFMIANSTGNYNIPVQAGLYTITPNLENPTYFNISPTNFTVNFPSQASPFAQDFCVTANGVKSDVEVVLLPTTPARPGFDAIYKLVYRNKGNQVENGSINLTFDDTRLDYVSSNPVYDNVAMNSFTWNYSNLQPFETREIGIVFNVNSPMETPAVSNGDVLNYTTTITTVNTDETPADNTFTLDQTVVGSYDPNDKTCLEGTTITPTEVGKYVHYVIRFENTGTYPAENIVVKDMIDLVKFDITTLVPLKSSHDFYTRINGNKVEFIFENINLDFNDATNDGYVVFKIKTKPSLVLGDTFTNNANIYFDYNFPITTNTYTTTVAALSTQDFDFGTYFTLYPNPAKDVLNIQTKQDLEVNSIEIYNQLGQIVMATTNAINSVDVANLASGTYFVKVNTEKGSANAKFVKE